jgi:hypothetical protein
MRRIIFVCLAVAVLLSVGAAAQGQTFSLAVPHPNSIWNQPYQSCQMGIRQGLDYSSPLYHVWKLRLRGATAPRTVTVSVTAQGTGNEPGSTLTAVLTDDVGAPVTGGSAQLTYAQLNQPNPTANLIVTLNADTTYTLTLTPSGGDRHYAIGASDPSLEIALDGGTPFRYLESGMHNFAVNAGAGEPVLLEVLADANGGDSPGYNFQPDGTPGTLTYTVFNPDMTVLIGPTTAAMSTTSTPTVVPISFTAQAAGSYIVQFVSQGHFYVEKLSGGDTGFYLMPCGTGGGGGGGGQITPGWNADYTMEFEGPRTAGDAIYDTLYPWVYNWRFALFTGASVTYTSPTITVNPNSALTGWLTPFTPSDTTLNAVNPPYIWVGPTMTQGSGGTFTSLRSTVTVPSGYPLGYSITRELVGGRIVAAGATEHRTFNVTVTPTDPTLNSIGVTADFLDPTWLTPGPVTASNVSCSAAEGQLQDLSTNGLIMWTWNVGTGPTWTPLQPGDRKSVV